MHGPRDYHTEWSVSDRKRQIYDITYIWNLKKKQTHRHRKWNNGYQNGKEGGIN